MIENINTYRGGPDEEGHFGTYGGRYVAETLMPLLLEVEKAYEVAKKDPEFDREFKTLLKHYVGRPSPLYFASRISKHCGGAKIYFKRDELNHTGAHKINNTLGQVLLARRMGKTRIIAETGAGQHGVATATVCALFGIPCFPHSDFIIIIFLFVSSNHLIQLSNSFKILFLSTSTNFSLPSIC